MVIPNQHGKRDEMPLSLVTMYGQQGGGTLFGQKYTSPGKPIGG